MSSRFRFGRQVLQKLRKRRQDTARTSGEVVAIDERLARLREALSLHKQALQEMLEAGADAMNVALYRQCISDIGKAIAAESIRLAAARSSLGLGDSRRAV